MRVNYYNRRGQAGMGSLELAISAVVGVIFVCVAIDLGIMMLGNQILDRATRDAARAAAGQSTATAAKQAAKVALGNHKADGFYVQTPQLSESEFVYFDNDGTPDGLTIPSGSNSGKKAGIDTDPAHVSVTATTLVNLPANLSLFSGAVSMQQGPLASGKMTFRRTYYFPIVKSALNSAFQ